MMTNKELLKTKLAAALKRTDASYAGQAREDLQNILRHGSPEEIARVKEASWKKGLTNVGGKIKSTTETIGKASKNLEPTVKLLGTLAAGIPIAKKLHKAHKLKKMSPLKRALTKGFGKDTIGRKTLTFGAGAAGIAGGIKGIEALSDSIATPIKKRSAFNNMMADNPGLKKENKKDVQKVFNTLYRFNPKMAADPLVAGSFMKRTLQFKEEGIQPVDVKTLTEVGRNMQSNKSNSSILSAAFLGGAKELAAFA